jgi:hypothetical protein
LPEASSGVRFINIKLGSWDDRAAAWSRPPSTFDDTSAVNTGHFCTEFMHQESLTKLMAQLWCGIFHKGTLGNSAIIGLDTIRQAVGIAHGR